MTKQEQLKGFTLLELLIVIAILSILAMALILVLNPAETMKKSRDTQRMTDLSTLKTALGLYTTNVSPVELGATADCFGTGILTAKIFYSTDSVACAGAPPATPATATGSLAGAGAWCKASANPSDANGGGWIPVDFSDIPGGSPISNLPLDPTNTVSTSPVAGDLAYRYACQLAGGANPSTVFEINAALESDAFTSTDDKRTKDGGDNDNMYEVGTNLKLLPITGAAF